MTASGIQLSRICYILRNTCLWCLLISGCASLPVRPVHDGLEIHFIDVGYGDAILVRRGESALFIDGGYPPMTRVVLDYLKDAKVDRLDALVLTHPHPDHIGGAFGILDAGIPVSAVYSAYPLDDPAMPHGFRQMIDRKIGSDLMIFKVLEDGDTVDLPGGLSFDVIHPDRRVEDQNDSSLVLVVEGFGGMVMMTSDIGPESQKRLLKEHPECFPVSILKAPHHGGKSLEEFYQVARPILTVISDGVNPYGNPDTQTLEAAGRWSGQVLRLSRTGTIIVRETRASRDAGDMAVEYPDRGAEETLKRRL